MSSLDISNMVPDSVTVLPAQWSAVSFPVLSTENLPDTYVLASGGPAHPNVAVYVGAQFAAARPDNAPSLLIEGFCPRFKTIGAWELVLKPFSRTPVPRTGTFASRWAAFVGGRLPYGVLEGASMAASFDAFPVAGMVAGELLLPAPAVSPFRPPADLDDDVEEIAKVSLAPTATSAAVRLGAAVSGLVSNTVVDPYVRADGRAVTGVASDDEWPVLKKSNIAAPARPERDELAEVKRQLEEMRALMMDNYPLDGAARDRAFEDRERAPAAEEYAVQTFDTVNYSRAVLKGAMPENPFEAAMPASQLLDVFEKFVSEANFATYFSKPVVEAFNSAVARGESPEAASRAAEVVAGNFLCVKLAQSSISCELGRLHAGAQLCDVVRHVYKYRVEPIVSRDFADKVRTWRQDISKPLSDNQLEFRRLVRHARFLTVKEARERYMAGTAPSQAKNALATILMQAMHERKSMSLSEVMQLHISFEREHPEHEVGKFNFVAGARPSAPNYAATVVCYRCGETGHMRAACTKPEPNKRFDPRGDGNKRRAAQPKRGSFNQRSTSGATSTTQEHRSAPPKSE